MSQILSSGHGTGLFPTHINNSGGMQPVIRQSGEEFYISPPPYFPPYVPTTFHCYQCGKIVLARDALYVYPSTINSGGWADHYCDKCSSFNRTTGMFYTRQDWIREGANFASGTPIGIIADWLEDQGRIKDAEYMRGL